MDARAAVQKVFREHHGWVLARLLRSLRDIDLAEEALQQALEAALTQWPRAGVPDAPRAWLVATAKHRAIDELRRRTLHTEKEEEITWLTELSRDADESVDLPIGDDMLRLIFTCCHPSLALPSQVALTLRTVAGLETEEIAKAFVVPAATLAQRLVRAKKKIQVANIPYVIPEASELPERLDGVLSVIYLVFNEGYAAMRGDSLLRRDLCRIAIDLARQVAELLPQNAESHGLLGLMVLTDARAAARTDASGDLVLLEDQDRSLWNEEAIASGQEIVKRALRIGPAGPYCLQAAIAAVHAEAKTAAKTDWRQILALYDRLAVTSPNPVVILNRAVAVAVVHGPERGLHAIDDVAEPLAQYYLLHAARADLLRRLEKKQEARDAYDQALGLCQNEPERRFLMRRRAQVG